MPSPAANIAAAQSTLRAIDRRARAYRNTVVPVALIFVIVSGLALGFRSWRLVAGYALILPIPCLFLWADSRIVRQWQQEMLEKWMADALDWQQMERAISGYPTAPQGVVHSMLATLDEARRSSGKDEQIAARVLEKSRRQERRMLVNAGVLVGVAAAICAATLLRSRPVLLAAAVGGVWFVISQRRSSNG